MTGCSSSVRQTLRRWRESLRALLSLERCAQAEALLPALPDSLAARVQLAEAEDDPERALGAYLQLGDDRSLWLAAGVLEARNEVSAALPLYLRVARGLSDYSDDAAFRAYVFGDA